MSDTLSELYKAQRVFQAALARCLGKTGDITVALPPSALSALRSILLTTLINVSPPDVLRLDRFSIEDVAYVPPTDAEWMSLFEEKLSVLMSMCVAHGQRAATHQACTDLRNDLCAHVRGITRGAA